MAASAESCGIDIQLISGKTERVADKFCTEKEVHLMREYGQCFSKLEQLNMLWTAKEALKKSLLSDQPTIFQGVTLTSVTIGDNTVRLQLNFPRGLAQPANVSALRLDDYMLAYTVAEQKNA
jgi:phosphopantetheinyl transferase (holo-ACP synthase)